MNRTSIRLVALALSTAVGSVLPAVAQDDTPVYLDAITIIGTGLPTDVMHNAASITIIEGEELQRNAPVSVSSLLQDIPGMQVSEQGIERISLRGEESRRVRILIDGQALTDHSTYGQPILVDPTTIERIEVVRGASSVVSGSRAIGGVINIITRKGADKPFALSTTGGWLSTTKGWRASTTASGTVEAGAGQMDYRLSYGRMKQGNRRTPDGELDPTSTSDRNLSGHLGYQLGDHYFAMDVLAYDLAANAFTDDPNYIVDLPQRDLRKLSLSYEGTNLTPWLDKLRVSAHQQKIEREFINDITASAGPAGNVRILSESHDKQRTSGIDMVAEMQLMAGTRTVAGIEYELDKLRTDKLSVHEYPFPPFGMNILRHDEAAIRTFSVFAQHEMDLPNDLTATIGGRWYRVKASQDVSTTDGAPNPLRTNRDSLAMGALGLVWAPTEDYALRANISQGYIYPTLGQLFLTTSTGAVNVQGNPDLRPERATTFELGARVVDGGHKLDATLFYTNSRDYISYFDTGSRTATYENVDRAKTWGLEVHAEYDSNVWGLTPYATVAVMRRKLEFSNGYTTADSGTPKVSGRIGVRRNWSLTNAEIGADLFLRGESAISMRDDTGTKNASASGWATLNLSTDIQWDNGVSLVAEFTNLTNRRYKPYGELYGTPDGELYVQMPGARRGVNLFLTKSF